MVSAAALSKREVRRGKGEDDMTWSRGAALTARTQNPAGRHDVMTSTLAAGTHTKGSRYGTVCPL